MTEKKWFLNGCRGSGRTIRLLCEIYENKIAALQQEFRKQTEEAKFEAFSVMCEKVAALEKENAELKEQNRSYEQLIDTGSITLVKERLKNYKQLTKAKKLLKQWVQYGHVNELLEQATLSFINME